MSMIVCSSLSTELFWRQVMFAWPMSPTVENLTPSLDTEMVTVSPMEERSRQMRWNSAEGIFTVAAYSVSGMPRCSESMSMSLSSKSEILSWSAIQKRRRIGRPGGARSASSVEVEPRVAVAGDPDLVFEDSSDGPSLKTSERSRAIARPGTRAHAAVDAQAGGGDGRRHSTGRFGRRRGRWGGEKGGERTRGLEHEGHDVARVVPPSS